MVKYMNMQKFANFKTVIVGRPNVGKSSLFNSVLGARKAIVESSSGTTRDRLHAEISWKGKRFTLVDTAGLEESKPGEMSELIVRQIRKGIQEADSIIFVTDGISGVLPEDRELSVMLRKTSKRIFLAVNKVDSERDIDRAIDFYELGLGEPYAISAMHKRGIDRLLNDIARDIEHRPETAPPQGVKVAIVGKPNVGKSSFVNALLDEERVIVHNTAGTTRDAIDIDLTFNGRDFILVDTAGIRHNPKLKASADFYGSVRSEEAIKRSDVAVMMIDGFDGLRKDDARIIDLCLSEGKPLVVAVNKWDLVKGTEMSAYKDRLIEEFDLVKNIPVIFISCKTGRNVKVSLDMIWLTYEKSRMVIDSERLGETLKELNGASQIQGKMIKLKCLAQEKTSPPSFVISLKDPRLVSDNLKRFIENHIRKKYGLGGVPIRVRYR